MQEVLEKKLKADILITCIINLNQQLESIINYNSYAGR